MCCRTIYAHKTVHRLVYLLSTGASVTMKDNLSPLQDYVASSSSPWRRRLRSMAFPPGQFQHLTGLALNNVRMLQPESGIMSLDGSPCQERRTVTTRAELLAIVDQVLSIIGDDGDHDAGGNDIEGQ